jgi:hypothetical protein
MLANGAARVIRAIVGLKLGGGYGGPIVKGAMAADWVVE